MEAATAVGEASPGIVTGTVIALAAILASQFWLSRGHGSFLSRLGAVLPPLLLAASSYVWLRLVSAAVPEPYLVRESRRVTLVAAGARD